MLIFVLALLPIATVFLLASFVLLLLANGVGWRR